MARRISSSRPVTCRREGIEAAVEGTEIIVHCAGSSKGDRDKARHLVRAASHAGVRRLVYISVVGADRIPVAGGIDRASYFASKLAAERIVADSGLPSTTLPLWLPGKAARAFRVGANLAPDRAVGRRTWEDFPTARASSPIDGRSGPRFSRLWNCCSMPAPSSVCPSIARRRRSRPQRTPCS